MDSDLSNRITAQLRKRRYSASTRCSIVQGAYRRLILDHPNGQTSNANRQINDIQLRLAIQASLPKRELESRQSPLLSDHSSGNSRSPVQPMSSGYRLPGVGCPPQSPGNNSNLRNPGYVLPAKLQALPQANRDPHPLQAPLTPRHPADPHVSRHQAVPNYSYLTKPLIHRTRLQAI